jgi:hypothetical protein
LQNHFDHEKVQGLFIRIVNNKSFSILKTPRYLNAFTDNFKDKIESIKSINRIELFEKSIYHKL